MKVRRIKDFFDIKKTRLDLPAAVAFLIAIAAFASAACILFKRPITGVADNGDFARIMNSTGLYYLSDDSEDRYFGYVNRLYGISCAIPFGGGYLSTQLPLVLLSIWLCKTATNTGLFDIRFLSAIYLLILITALYFFAKYSVKKTGIAGVIPVLSAFFMFCDTAYISYFNSLYGEPVTYVFLLLAASMAVFLSSQDIESLLRYHKPATPPATDGTGYNTCMSRQFSEGKPGAKMAICMAVVFYIALILFAGAKVQNTPVGLLAAVLCIKLGKLAGKAGIGPAATGKAKITAPGWQSTWRKLSIIAAVLAVAVSLVCYASVSGEIKVCNKYQTVFYGILKDSENPARDLAELGLDPALAVLAGTNYFMDEYPVNIRTPEFKRMLFDKVNYTNVAGFYLKHPSRLLEKLEIAANNGFKLKQGFGNYEKYPGVYYKMTSDIFCFWSDFKMNVLPHTLLFVFIYYSAALLIIFYEYKKAETPCKRFLAEFYAFIVLTGILQFALPVLGDGEADLSKHLFLFNVSFDLLFAAGLTYFTQKVTAAIRLIKIRHMTGKFQLD